MRKMLIVGWREFRQRVKSRGFLIGSIFVPLILLLVFAFGAGFADEEQNPLQQVEDLSAQEIQLGYVDRANLIETIPPNIPAGTLRAYAGQAAADQALAQGEINAYYLIPEDYRQTGEIQRVSQELPVAPTDTQLINWVLVTNLFPDASAEQIRRLNWPFNNTGPQFVNLEAGSEETASGNPMLPFLVTVAVMIPLFTSGSYLLQSLTKEKSDRIMEILLVSLRPWHILAGKLLGLGALTFVQYLLWASIGGLGLLISGQDLAEILQGINLSAQEALLVVPYALGGFLLYAGIMAGIGALAPDMESSRGWVFFISLPMLLPMYFWFTIVDAPNGTLALVLSMVPFSAPIAMLMRMISAAVPAWQIAISMGLLVLTAAGMILLMARLFRVKTLLSGESLSLGRFFETVSG